MNTYIEIKDRETDEVIERYDVTGKPERIICAVRRGIIINLNHREFYIWINETEKNHK